MINKLDCNMYQKETVLAVKQLFESIANTTSSNEKLSLLKNFATTKNSESIAFLKSILNSAYNPQIRFFLKPIALSDEEKKDKNRLVIDDKKLNELLESAKVHIMCSAYPSIFHVLERFATREVTGDEAKVQYLAYILRNQNGQSTFDEEISPFLIKLFNDIIDKDLKIGISTSTINKVFPKLIPEMGYMRCSLIKAITAKEVDKWLNNQIISQEKMDGMFINLNVNDEDNIEFISRAGSVFPIQSDNLLVSNLFKPVLEEIQDKLTIGYQYHGEMLMLDSDGNILPRQISNGLFNAILKNSNNSRILDENQLKDYSILISLWDRIPLELIQLSSLHGLSNTELAKSHHNSPYIERLNKLKDELDGQQSTNNQQKQLQLVETRYYNSILDADEHFKQMLKEGKEGTIVKLPTMLWKDGTSKEQIKLKNEFCIELKIKDFVIGSGKNVDLFGSITCVSNDDENEEHLMVNVPSSGFTDSMKKEIAANKDRYIGKIMTVKANNIMSPTDDKKNYSLFLPVFIEFREDKDEADSLLKIKEQYESSINGALQEQIKQLINKSKK